MENKIYTDCTYKEQKAIDACPRDGGWHEINGWWVSIGGDGDGDGQYAAFYTDSDGENGGECDLYVTNLPEDVADNVIIVQEFGNAFKLVDGCWLVAPIMADGSISDDWSDVAWDCIANEDASYLGGFGISE